MRFIGFAAAIVVLCLAGLNWPEAGDPLRLGALASLPWAAVVLLCLATRRGEIQTVAGLAILFFGGRRWNDDFALLSIYAAAFMCLGVIWITVIEQVLRRRCRHQVRTTP